MAKIFERVKKKLRVMRLFNANKKKKGEAKVETIGTIASPA